MSRTIEIKVELVNDEMEGLLWRLHTLLMAHRYDHLLGELLGELCPLLPGVETYYKALDAKGTDPKAQPKVLDLVDSLLALEATHAQEALCLGYVVGRAQVTPREIGNPTPMGPRQIISHLGLTELMAYNLSFSYALTEKATARLKERSPE